MENTKGLKQGMPVLVLTAKDAWEGIVISNAATFASCQVVKKEQAEQLAKQHGTTWALEVTDEQTERVKAAEVVPMAKGPEGAKLIAEFRAEAKVQAASTAKLKAIGDQLAKLAAPVKTEKAKPKAKAEAS